MDCAACWKWWRRQCGIEDSNWKIIMRTIICQFLCGLALLACAPVASADEPTSAPSLQTDDGHAVINLWPGVAPGSENWTQKEISYKNTWDHKKMVRNVTRPTVTVYPADPAKASGTAIIIAPGGGFRFLSWQNEGTAVAEWLAARGVSVFVLKYRLLDTGDSLEDFEKKMNNRPRTKPAGMDIAELASVDGRQAMKIVRQRCAEWKIAPDRIGIMGFSAGGVVAMGVVNQHDADTHPDFAAPIYGTGPESAIPKDAPPLFILCAGDDKGGSRRQHAQSFHNGKQQGSVRSCMFTQREAMDSACHSAACRSITGSTALATGSQRRD